MFVGGAVELGTGTLKNPVGLPHYVWLANGLVPSDLPAKSGGRNMFLGVQSSVGVLPHVIRNSVSRLT